MDALRPFILTLDGLDTAKTDTGRRGMKARRIESLLITGLIIFLHWVPFPNEELFHWVPFPNEPFFHWGTSPNVIGYRSPMKNSKKSVFMRVCNFSVLYITMLLFLQVFKFGVQYGFQVKNHVL